MWPNLSFLSATSNANPKPGDLLKCKKGVLERLKAFAITHRGDEDRQPYIFCSSVIVKAEAWQVTCLSLKSNPKSVHSLLYSVAGVSSSSSSCPSLIPLSAFSSNEFFSAAANLSSSNASGPYKVAHLFLKHLPRSGLDFLHHIFNLAWSLHLFPFIWKTSSIILIHIIGRHLHFPSF